MKSNKMIGSKIRNIRETKNLTLSEVAERSGLKEEQVRQIEENQVFPSLAPLIRIARVLGVRLGTFLDDQNELGLSFVEKKRHKAKVSALPTTIPKDGSICPTSLCRKTSPAAIWSRS